MEQPIIVKRDIYGSGTAIVFLPKVTSWLIDEHGDHCFYLLY